ncbi:acetylserotonin O-methyltransferase-like [Pelobates fuscus]|uniref:acetylserotonin O-methyltransferase-like n=1 Tax=Pelobates fuscus TaxID=191477 RepID=UPI002FE451C4
MSSSSDCSGTNVLQESSSSDSKNADLLQEYIHAFIISKVVFSACELNVFDVLAGSEVPLPLTAISELLGTSIRGTEILLDACVGLKLLKADNQNGEVLYKNTELAHRYLRKTSSKSLFSSIIHYSPNVFRKMDLLTDSVKQGIPVCKMQHGNPEDAFFNLYRSEEQMIEFLQCMESSWLLFDKEAVMSAFDLSSFKIICDLGGGTGTLAKVCDAMYPTSSVILYDLPEIIQVTQEHFISKGDNRISFQKGNFFKDPLPDADLFILSRILHDWDDDTCLKLLKKIYMACKPGDGVLIIEMLLNEDRTGPLIAQLTSILMLVVTDGKERTLSAFKTLLETAGFKDIQLGANGKIMEVILARK